MPINFSMLYKFTYSGFKMKILSLEKFDPPYKRFVPCKTCKIQTLHIQIHIEISHIYVSTTAITKSRTFNYSFIQHSIRNYSNSKINLYNAHVKNEEHWRHWKKTHWKKHWKKIMKLHPINGGKIHGSKMKRKNSPSPGKPLKRTIPE